MATTRETDATNWAALSTAQRLAQENGITSPTGWAAFARKYKGRRALPLKPDEAYGDKWPGWTRFLGADSRVGRPKKYWPYAKASKYVQQLGLKTKEAFIAFARTDKCPLEVPVAPHHVYKGAGWEGYAMFLGTPVRGMAASRQYWPYEMARDYVQTLAFKSTAEWAKWSRSGEKPVEIPGTPHLTYRGEGWTNWADFLGPEYRKVAQLTGLRRTLKLLPYAKAREVVAALSFQTAQDFRIWAKSGARPENIPIHPEIAYKGKTWKGWPHFLGHEKARRGVGLQSMRNVLSYSAAATLVRSLKLKGASEYQDLLKKGQLPNGLPAQPSEHYKESGWTSWGAFLGVRGKSTEEAPALKVRPDGLLRFGDARKLARSLQLPNTAAWFKYATSARRPVYLPKEPWKAYFQEGYVSLEDFIGVPAEVVAMA